MGKPGPHKFTVNGIDPTSIHDYVDQLEDRYHKVIGALKLIMNELDNPQEEDVRLSYDVIQVDKRTQRVCWETLRDLGELDE